MVAIQMQTSTKMSPTAHRLRHETELVRVVHSIKTGTSLQAAFQSSALGLAAQREVVRRVNLMNELTIF